MKLTPEIVLVSDETLARVAEALEAEIAHIERCIDERPDLAQLCVLNGWTARSIAWGTLLGGVLTLAGYPHPGAAGGDQEDTRG